MINYTITRSGFTFTALSTPPDMVKWELTDATTGELIAEALLCAADWEAFKARTGKFYVFP